MLRIILLSLALVVTFSLPTREGRPDCAESDTLLTDLAGFRLYGLSGADTLLLSDSSISEPGRRCTVTVASKRPLSAVLAVAYDRAGNLSCPRSIAPTASVEPVEPIPAPTVPVHQRCGGRP